MIRSNPRPIGIVEAPCIRISVSDASIGTAVASFLNVSAGSERVLLTATVHNRQMIEVYEREPSRRYQVHLSSHVLSATSPSYRHLDHAFSDNTLSKSNTGDAVPWPGVIPTALTEGSAALGVCSDEILP